MRMGDVIENPQHHHTIVRNSLVNRAHLSLSQQSSEDLSVLILAHYGIADYMHDGEVLCMRAEKDLVCSRVVGAVGA